jgi:Sigma-54 interaction domain/FHA domain/Bacterial regulatory protein, Fis family
VAGPKTRDHEAPAPASDPVRRRPLLLVAFPRPGVLPLPSKRAPIGRDWFASHGVLDPEVSGTHAAFSVPGGSVHLEDAGSRNGTWVDGHRLTSSERVPLAEGAVVRMGRTLMVFREELQGDPQAASSIGELVGPFGVRGLSAALVAWTRRPPGTVLIEGETGTGKELAAAAVARALGRASAFTAVNVASMPPGVFESQLFGHVAGAFSGAGKGSPGVVASCQGGTVFLDEIGELSLEAQAKILRLIENHEIFPVGASRPTRVDVLIVAATNRALEGMVERETFRRDLLARLAICRVELPPLRERPEDLFAVAQAMCARASLPLPTEACEVEAVERLMLEPWPTNARGLLACVERVAVLDPIPGLRAWAVDRVLGPKAQRAGQLSLDAVGDALARCWGNETQAARLLGVTRGKLRRFLERG